MKQLVFLGILFLSTTTFSQNGYVQQTVYNNDTSSVFSSDQVFWKLQVGETYFLIESILSKNGDRKDIKHPVLSREYDGDIKEFVVDGMNRENFTIRFHLRDHTVTYIYKDKSILYRGKNVDFRL